MIRVLIVEDDPMVAQLNRNYADSIEGFKVTAIAGNGEIALEKLSSGGFDLMILDIFMPKLDGLKLMKTIREQQIMLDIILVTAAKEVENIDEVLKLGAIDYLIKPFDFERFKRSLLSYRERYTLLKNKKIIHQRDIDFIIDRSPTAGAIEMQKGLNERTLKRIKGFIKEYKHAPFSCDEISIKLGISRVTLRRYLEYLSQTGEVQIDMEYGNVGRPSYIYRYITTD